MESWSVEARFYLHSHLTEWPSICKMCLNEKVLFNSSDVVFEYIYMFSTCTK